MRVLQGGEDINLFGDKQPFILEKIFDILGA